MLLNTADALTFVLATFEVSLMLLRQRKDALGDRIIFCKCLDQIFVHLASDVWVNLETSAPICSLFGSI